jgi:hypothetical protein
MRAAPPFELDVTLGRAERALVATIGGTCAALLGAWVWSHVDAAAGPAGRGPLNSIAVSVGSALVGGWLGWWLAPRSSGTLAWRQGQWTLRRPAMPACDGMVQAKLDVGSWMLLCFRPVDGGRRSSWLTASSRKSGPAWHALRATLFAPGAAAEASSRDEGTRA